MNKKLKTLADYRTAALSKLTKQSPGLAEYVYRTAGDGKCFRGNMNAFSQYAIPYHTQREHTLAPNTCVKVLGWQLQTPVMIAPTAFHGMFTERAEAATYEAADALGTIHVVSSFSTYDFPKINDELSRAWYQLLMYNDLDLMKVYIDKAIKAGCSAIVLTVDAVTGCSMCKTNSKVASVEFPPMLTLPLLPRYMDVEHGSLDEYYGLYMPSELNWGDIKAIVQYSKVPVVLKGLLSSEDVEKAIEAGAKAVIISNHGGRQNDELPSTLESLAALPPHLKDQIEIYLDGGIQCGEDVFKALALGARAVLVGRPILNGLAVEGTAGAIDILKILTEELSITMQHSGCQMITDIRPGMVVKI